MLKIILITQDDPFYLGGHIGWLLENIPPCARVVAAVVLRGSPFGRKELLVKKVAKTYEIFGAKFFLRFGLTYLTNKFRPQKNIKRVLMRHKIPLIRITHHINHPETVSALRTFAPDLLISIAANEIFKREIIELAPKGCFNLHSALLPKYRGLFPSFWVLKNNEDRTGVSVFQMDEGIDSGPILVQMTIPIRDHSLEKLIEETKALGMKAIIEAIRKMDAGDIRFIPNDDASKTYYSFPTREDVREFLMAGKRFF